MPENIKEKLKCPFCANTYLEQVNLAQYDALAYRTTSVFAPTSSTGHAFYLHRCPACNTVFDTTSMFGINYKTLEEQKELFRAIEVGKRKKEDYIGEVASEKVNIEGILNDPKVQALVEAFAQMTVTLETVQKCLVELNEWRQQVNQKLAITPEEPVPAKPEKKPRKAREVVDTEFEL